jgi:murein DD-endopeptidase MepM/ murein hydrolase activator NlpD
MVVETNADASRPNHPVQHTHYGALLLISLFCISIFIGGYLINQNNSFDAFVAAHDHSSEGGENVADAANERSIPLPPSNLPKRQSATLIDLARFFGGNPDVLVEVPVRARSGDTMLTVLQKAGVDRLEAHVALRAVTRVWDPRDMQPGLDVAVVYRNGATPAEPRHFVGVYFRPDYEQDVVLYRDAQDNFAAEVQARTLTRTIGYGFSVIQSSLFDAGTAAGIPVGVLIEMIQAFSYNVDFQRDLKPGDYFELMYEKFTEADGNMARTGRILYAGMNLNDKWQRIYYYAPPKSKSGEFYDASGQSIKRALLRTPIDGARMTSGFGMRTHPVLGYSSFHKGIDFGAPTGTPIRAAGSGQVEKIGVFGAYGNYIRLKHNKEFSTAYAHLSRYRSGLKVGTAVKQGDVIGYVGSTGRSTGPHLHYEILRFGNQINPGKVNLPTGQQLAGAELKSFKSMVSDFNEQVEIKRAAVQSAAKKTDDTQKQDN